MRLFNLYIQYNTHSTVVNPYVSKNNKEKPELARAH